MFKSLMNSDVRLLVYPMIAYVVYMFLIGIYNFKIRFQTLITKETPINYFKAYQGTIPDHVAVIGRHYDHQFELPLLFLIGCCAHLAVRDVNMYTVWLAWAFLVSRVVHSYIHLGKNNVRHRFIAFFAGWVIVLLLFGQLASWAASSS